MYNWENLFDSVALSRAKAINSDRVTVTKKDETHVDGAILGMGRTEVSIIFRNKAPFIMKCKCPKARSGRNCEHMAAVLYQLEAENKPKKKVVAKSQLEAEQKAQEEAQREQEAKRKAQEEAQREQEAKRKAQEEAQRQQEAKRKAQEEEEKRIQEAERLKKEELQQRIAEKKAQKAAKRAERKQKRIAAEEAARIAREQEAKRKAQEEEEQRIQEAQRKAQKEAERQKAEMRRKEQELEAMRKKEEKIQAAIAQKNKAQTDAASHYQYFNVDSVIKELEIPKNALAKGQEYLDTEALIVNDVNVGYFQNMDEMVIQINASATRRTHPFPVSVTFSRDSVLETICSCPECGRSNSYFWYSRKDKKCAYIAAALLYARSYIKEKEIGDATDKCGAMLLADFQRYHTNQIVANATLQEESLMLSPRLTRYDTVLRISFKIGTNKLYVIKDLIEFCRQVENSESAQYGTNTKFNQSIDNFTPRAKQWYDYINKVIQEEEDIVNRISEMRFYYYEKKRKCSDFELYGWRLDQFFEVLGDDAIEYEDKSTLKKEKKQLVCKEGTPRLTMQISKSKIGEKKEFHGIDVSCNLPVFFLGSEKTCYIDNDILYKTDISITEKIRPFLSMNEHGKINFQIGRGKLTDFYYSMLPQIEDVFTVIEKDSEEIHKYLPPEVSFVFYLDTENSDITCRATACYGEREYSIIATYEKESNRTAFEHFRLEGREREIYFLTRQIFPYVDSERDLFCCNSEEDKIYDVLNNGVERLAELGEVRCTSAFKRLNIVRKMRMSIGVSVASGLLDLEIETENISREDLLDVLKGYKLQKKYYRLKNGDFINLEDENLQTLKELMDTMHLPPKDFIKGKVHLPIYRTLYLDKLLEEKEGVYTNRDHTFRKMVKNFKTISDADYEVPSSLKRIMRGYQKNGFQWLKTLQSCQFGGILADDMGLGKTIQAISFLLSEQNAGVTTLVVCPASLVFNWGEEFARFGSKLKVQLITGDQQERQKKIEAYTDYDVSVTSYDLLRRDISYYEEKKFTYEIIDEAQYIKNHTTAAAKAVKVIDSQMRIALTGTPIENRLSELWSIFDFLMPGFLYSYDVFKKELETPIAKYNDQNAMARLQRMVGPFIMRRLKSDVLKDLPDKLEEVRYVKFEQEQQTVYDAQVVHMQEILAQQNEEDFNKNKMKILAELTRLRQICCDPALCFENYQGASAKLDSCIELVQSALDSGHKMLLFSQFTSMLELIKKRLDAEGISYYVITGETSKEKRLQLVKAFNENEIPVFLISLKAGGVGLNLTGADVVIHYDPWWNIAAQNQATDRAHRIGQTKKVTVYKLIARHSVEEKILKLQETKRDLAEQVMNGELGHLGSMSKEELLDLLQGVS